MSSRFPAPHMAWLCLPVRFSAACATQRHDRQLRAAACCARLGPASHCHSLKSKRDGSAYINSVGVGARTSQRISTESLQTQDAPCSLRRALQTASCEVSIMVISSVCARFRDLCSRWQRQRYAAIQLGQERQTATPTRPGHTTPFMT